MQSTVQVIGSTWAFKEGRIEIEVRDAWAAVCVLFLHDWAEGDAAICGNPNCLARYFIEGRKNQRFCGNDACFVFAARKRSLAWWEEHGNEWRDQRRRKAHKKGRKQQ